MKIKLNPELCPDNEKDNPRFQFGALCYLPRFLNVEFEVIEELEDSFHGKMVKLSSTKFSNIYFRKEDCIVIED